MKNIGDPRSVQELRQERAEMGNHKRQWFQAQRA